MKNNNTTKKYLGPKETEVIARLSYEKVSIITIKQFDDFFNFSPELRYQIIFRLRKKGILTNIKKGVYIFSPLESGPAGRNINEFLIASVLFPDGNYYIGYSTMYNYYGFTEQIYQTMFILNTTMQREKVISGLQFKIIKVSDKRMYGLEKIKANNAEVIISDKERTLVDLIYFPNPVGGLKKSFEIVKNQISNKKTDIRKFIKYASIFPSVSTRKRIGFIIDSCGLNSRKLAPLWKSIKGTSLITLYNTKSRKGRINKKWGIIENAAPK